MLFAPVDVVLSDRTVGQPDLLMARRSDFTSRDLPIAPLLAVEILSDSTEHYDRMWKRSRFESAGAGSFWIVDPRKPALVAWELENGTYDEVFRATRPFGVEVRPADLIL